MGFYLTEPITWTAAESRSAVRRSRMSRPHRRGAKNRIGVPTGRSILSTKYLDQETGLYYYGYRYYNPSLGRWPARDPIGEFGGENLYLISGNNAICMIDTFGLQTSGSLYGECIDTPKVTITDKVLEKQKSASEWIGASQLEGGPDLEESGPYTCICRCEAWKNYIKKIRRTTVTEHHMECGQKCTNKLTLDWTTTKTENRTITRKGYKFADKGPFTLWTKLFPTFRIHKLVEAQCEKDCDDLCGQLFIPDEPPVIIPGGQNGF